MVNNIQDKYIDLLNELYRSFNFFNIHFCNGELKQPIITIQRDTSNTLGWYGRKFWSHGKPEEENRFDEINLTAETLHRKPKDVLETLLHEMAHQKNGQDEIKDCSASQYHNEHFKKSAEKFGLVVEKMQGKGWAKTSLGQRAIDAIEKLQPKEECYGIVRNTPKKLPLLPKTITLQVGVEYEDKIEYLLKKFEGKRDMTEQAIEKLYEVYQREEKLVQVS